MKSLEPGKDISPVEVTNVSRHGLWVFLQEREYFLPYDKFPWFKNARLSEILDVQLLHGFHLHWPALDLDLDTTILDNPEDSPLVASPR